MSTRDFNIKIYTHLLKSLIKKKYVFTTYERFIIDKPEKCVIIRHDIDASKNRALVFAKLEFDLGIQSSYYFRIVSASFSEEIINKVISLKHEIGYHYEDLALCNGNFAKAIKLFETNLNKFRRLYPVKTICMHGRAISKIDNRALWQKYNYRDYGIIGEPYFDIDYNKVLYLTDTGQAWNGNKFSIRDKVKTTYDFDFKTTFDILTNIDKLPDQILITTHPDRWAFNNFEWYLINIHMKTRDKIKKIVFYKRGNNIFK